MPRVKPKLVVAFFSLLFIGMAGCARPLVGMAMEPRSFEPSDYQEVFTTWSRDLYLYPVNGLHNVITARATYLSHEFRSAYVVRVAHDFRLSSAEHQDLLRSELQAQEENHEFFVTVMSGIKGSDELDPKEGPWHIHLEDDKGQKIAPIEVLEIKKPSANETKYFDFDVQQRKAYRIIFPVIAQDGQPILTKSTRFFSLMFSSALGQGDLRWKTTLGQD